MALKRTAGSNAKERAHALEILQALFDTRERTEGEARRFEQMQAVFGGSALPGGRAGGKLKLIGGQ